MSEFINNEGKWKKLDAHCNILIEPSPDFLAKIKKDYDDFKAKPKKKSLKTVLISKNIIAESDFYE